jgi:hypothetical protein
MAFYPNESDVLNGFRSPSASTSGTPDDNQFVISATGTGEFAGVAYTGTQINAVLSGSGNGTVILNQVVTAYSANGAIAVAGKAAIAAGTGLAAMTLAAPVPYGICDINIVSRTSGDVVFTCAAGVTFDGTNNTATFNAVNDRLTIGYKSATQWEIFLNNSVVLSLV